MSFIKKFVRGENGNSRSTAMQNDAAESAMSDVESKPSLNEEFRVSRSQILLNQVLSQKSDVLQLISKTMLTMGFVNQDYYPALAMREEKISTYLVNGVAIPHGVNEAKNLVAKTGVVIVQIPQGVVWNDKGDVVKIAVGIAAKGDEHLNLLQKLTTVVMDQALSQELAITTNVNDFLIALNQNQETEHPADDYSISVQVLVIDAAGIHARPASLISELAAKYNETKISIRNDSVSSNAKSMASLIAMGAKKGDALVVSAEGVDAQRAVDEISRHISAGLDSEDENTNSQYNPLKGLAALSKANGRLRYTGAAASPGIATARIHKLATSNISVIQESGVPSQEKAQLQNALSVAITQLAGLHEKLKSRAPKEAEILNAQQQLLRDELILEDAFALIEQRNSAAWSFQESVEKQVTALNQVQSERIKARVADFVDVRERVLAILVRATSDSEFPTTDFILAAKDLSPSQTASLEGLPIKGICTELGGPNSHMAILARALGIPAIVGLGDGSLSSIEAAETATIDPQGSQLILSPDESTLLKADQTLTTWEAMRKAQSSQKHEPAITLDGHRVGVVCNIAKPEDAPRILEGGGEGAGLLRTEFLFETAESEPCVEQQMDALKAIAKTLGDRQLVVRTCDIGGDKPVSWMDMPHEDNPFLGVRGIRLSFKFLDVFERQLEAIYRTALWQVEAEGSTGIHIMFPMIAKLSEWQKAKEIAERIRINLSAPVLPVGIMIEVPSAVLIADHFAKEVDFFSVGSNDLTQYTLAMDRLHTDLCKESDNYHPAILNMIAMTVKAAQNHGKWVGVCGNMAADPNVAALLVGIGVDELSVSPANVAAVKNIIRSVSYENLKCKAKKALEMGSSESVMALYKNHDDLM